jgi:hypothetical protein
MEGLDEQQSVEPWLVVPLAVEFGLDYKRQ